MHLASPLPFDTFDKSIKGVLKLITERRIKNGVYHFDQSKWVFPRRCFAQLRYFAMVTVNLISIFQSDTQKFMIKVKHSNGKAVALNYFEMISVPFLP